MTETGDSGSFPAEMQLDMFGPPRMPQGQRSPDQSDVVATTQTADGLSQDDARQLRLELETQLARLDTWAQTRGL